MAQRIMVMDKAERYVAKASGSFAFSAVDVASDMKVQSQSQSQPQPQSHKQSQPQHYKAMSDSLSDKLMQQMMDLGGDLNTPTLLRTPLKSATANQSFFAEPPLTRKSDHVVFLVR